MSINFLGAVIAVAMAFLLLELRRLILILGKRKRKKLASNRSTHQYTFKPLPLDKCESNRSRAARQMVAPANDSIISAEQFLAELRAHARAGADGDASGEAGSVLEFDINRRSPRAQSH